MQVRQNDSLSRIETTSANRANGVHVSVEDHFAGSVVEQTPTVARITSPAPVQVHIRSLEAVATASLVPGLAITSLTESHPSSEQAKDQWWRANFTRPMFLLPTATLASRKPGVSVDHLR